ncbi:MAG: carboxypeptidase-like regulatory domain-containing protein, partial [Thermoanaerobaculia bacterium]|nr:carboxypeptidase-like regulatory domain-containing protein [Thermoanaerobaculia bacterium]
AGLVAPPPAEVAVRFQLPAEGPVVPAVLVAARPLVALDAAVARPEAVSARLPREGGWLALDPAWIWGLRSADPNYWSEEVQVRVGPESTAPALRLWPAGMLAGLVKVPAGAEWPGELAVRFSGLDEKAMGPSGTEYCPIDSVTGRFTCRLPAGSHWLRLAAAPYQPVYRDDLAIPIGASASAGEIALRRGSSAVGFLRYAAGRPAAGIAVSVSPAVADPPRGSASPPTGISHSAKTDARGFFQVTGLVPGSWRVQVEAEGFAALTSAIFETLPDLESELTAPLVLEKPIAIEIALEPPLDDRGAAWRLRLFRLGPEGETGEPITGAVDELGVFRHVAVAPGRYLVAVDGSAGERVAREERTFTAEHPVAWIELGFVSVTGVVTFGTKEAAPGTLWFGTRHGARRIEAIVAEEGDYAVRLPAAGPWRISWSPKSASEGTEIELEPVEIPEKRRFRLELRLPDTRIAGEVVDEEGQPVADAEVRVTALAGSRPTLAAAPTDEKGRFRLRGLPAGPLSISARRGRAVADKINAQIGEGLEPPAVRLVLVEEVRWTGRVTADGRGLPGVRISLWPNLGPAGLAITEAVSGAGGFFEVDLPGSAVGIQALLLAPNRAATFVSRPLVPGTELAFEIASLGGELSIPTTTHAGALTSAVLVANGTLVPWPLLTGLLAGRFEGPGGVVSAFTFHALAPGAYRLCVGAGALRYLVNGEGQPPTCSDGLLVPGGLLVLEALSPDS